MDCLPCGIVILDHQARVVSINKALENIIGTSQEMKGNGAGQSMRCVWTLNDKKGCGHVAACHGCKMRRVVLSAVNGKRVTNESTPLEVLVDGCMRSVPLKISAIPFTMNNKRFVVMVIMDITPLVPSQPPPKNVSFHGIIGTDPKMVQLFKQIKNVAKTDASVLIQGESGTGKELVATAIHKESIRDGHPFVPFNCGALSEGTVESELFGHVKGAFTGAVKEKKGRFELANSGTLFLDEVGELSPAVQVKLLRVLQDGTFERVGGEKTIQINVRVISATNKDLNQEVVAGRFRRDLYYRLCVVPFYLPPLRDRIGDLSSLLAHYTKVYSDGDVESNISSKAMNVLGAYAWPGNVRELQNVIQYALISSHNNVIDIQNLPPHLNHPQTTLKSVVKKRSKLDPAAVATALAKTEGNKQQAAKLLGVSRSTLYRFFGQNEDKAAA